MNFYALLQLALAYIGYNMLCMDIFSFLYYIFLLKKSKNEVKNFFFITLRLRNIYKTKNRMSTPYNILKINNKEQTIQ